MKVTQKNMIYFACLLLSLLLLTSCSFFSPVKPSVANKYVINTIPSVSTKPTHPVILFITMPETRPIYDTTQMAYTLKPFEISYYSQNEWAETPSQMLLPLLTQTLQNTHYFQAVVTPPYNGQANYILNTQVLELKQTFTKQNALLNMTIRAQLIDNRLKRIIATKVFKTTQNISSKNPYSGVLAANRATARLLHEISEFCLANIK
jgi:cholesterol transport system auxiliary component